MTQPVEDEARKLASEHVEWLIELLIPIIRRIGIEEFRHGFGHGYEEATKHGLESQKKG